MDAKTYLKVSGINLLFLLIGVSIGIAGVYSSHALNIAYAQSKSGEATKAEPVAVAEDPNVEYVTPGIGLGGPVATNILLAGRIACDRLQVNGFDPLQLHDAILTLLLRKGIATPADLQAVIESGKTKRPIRIKPQPPQAPAPK